MKKLLLILMSALIMCSAAACVRQETLPASSSPSTGSQTASQSSENDIDELLGISSADSGSGTEPVDHQSNFDRILKDHKFEGIAYAVKDGEEFAYVCGENETGTTFTQDMIIPVGSISKQFCAADILLLQEQGKLSIEDTLDKYFPEYKEGGKITLKQMMCMRSGITTYDENIYDIVSYDSSYEENSDKIIRWLFSQPLVFQPDEGFHYSNGAYYLLATIVEKVTGQRYMDNLRENVLDPLGMRNTGSIDEMAAGAEWTKGVLYKNIDLQPGITKGGGDIITTSKDLTLWMNSLTNGTLLSGESYKLMTTDYTPAEGYGLGIRLNFFGGIGHPGQIGSYVSMECADEKYDLTVFVSGDTVDVYELNSLFSEIIRDLKS